MVYTSNKKQLIDALRENLMAIEYCLNYVKEDSNKTHWKSNKGCLGFSATILMSSVIDALGSAFDGENIIIDGKKFIIKLEKLHTHYYILNHNEIFNLNLEKETIEDFHKSFRNTLIHNNSLTKNSFLRKGSLCDEIFCLDEEDKIKEIRLVPLFDKIKVAVSIFISKLESGQYEIRKGMSDMLLNPTKANIILCDVDTDDLSGNSII